MGMNRLRPTDVLPGPMPIPNTAMPMTFPEESTSGPPAVAIVDVHILLDHWQFAWPLDSMGADDSLADRCAKVAIERRADGIDLLPDIGRSGADRQGMRALHVDPDERDIAELVRPENPANKGHSIGQHDPHLGGLHSGHSYVAKWRGTIHGVAMVFIRYSYARLRTSEPRRPQDLRHPRSRPTVWRGITTCIFAANSVCYCSSGAGVRSIPFKPIFRKMRLL